MSPEQRAQGLLVLAQAKSSAWADLVSRVDSLMAQGAPRLTLLVAMGVGLEPTKGFAAVQDWRENRRTGTLVLSGSVGAGKSVAAARWAISTRAVWCHVPTLGLMDHAQASRAVQRLSRARALVLDELGGQGSTGPAAVARVTAVLSRRHSEARPTVVTTNLGIEAIADVYDGVPAERSRLIDRIYENGAYVECRRELSFRRDRAAAVGPDQRENRYSVAAQGQRDIEALSMGSTDTATLDRVQDALAATDEDVQKAAQSNALGGYTPKIEQQVASLLERASTQPHAPATCGSRSAPAQSESPYGGMESIS